MRKRTKTILSILVILIVIAALSVAIITFLPHDNAASYKLVDEINNYGYKLEDRDSPLMQDIFKKLKNVLESSEIDYKLYAEYLSELFVIDLFTLDNKDSKYDIGGEDYVLPDVIENYELNVSDTIYRYIENKDNRDEDYPIVSNVSLISNDLTNYTYDSKEYEAYKTVLEISYENGDGFYQKGEITTINKDNMLYVVSFKGVE